MVLDVQIVRIPAKMSRSVKFRSTARPAPCDASSAKLTGPRAHKEDRHVPFVTFFGCTNADQASVTIGVEVFGPAGGASINNAATTAISVAPGATVLFGTQTTPSLTIDGNLATGSVSKGSARILATSKKIVCTAFLADPSGTPPVSMVSLTIVAKTKQKAAN